MTFWINQHVVETRERIQQWRTNRHVNMVTVMDHVELARTHTILGLAVGWQNMTEKPITVTEIQVILYKKNQEDILLRLLPLERFSRPELQRTMIKTPLSQFKLRPGQSHSERIRFVSHQTCDIPSGLYTLDIQIRDTNNVSYTRRTKLEIETRMKYRLTDDWTETVEKEQLKGSYKKS